MDEEILRIRFGVAGGSSLNGESGRDIAADLTKIAQSFKPFVRFRVARDQQTVFQSELDSIAKNLKLNITAHISGIDDAAGSTGGTSTRRQRKQTSNSGEKDKQTEKIRAEQIALREYKKTYGEVIQLQKTAAKLDADDPQQKYIKRKLGNLITYGKKQEAIINASQSASLRAEKAATDEANALKAKNSLLDVAQQKVKAYATELTRLNAKIPAETGSKYGDVKTTLTSYAKDQMQLGNFENAKIAEDQVNRLTLAYKAMGVAAKAAQGELNKPISTDSSPEAGVQRINQALANAKAQAATFATEMKNASDLMHGLRLETNFEKGFSNATKSAETFYNKYKDLIRVNSEFSRAWDELLRKLNDGEFKTPQEAFIAINKLETATIKAGLTVETFGQKIKRVFGERVVGIISAVALNAARKALRDMYQNVVDLDDALTEFSIVSGKTGSSLEKFSEQAFESAKRIRAGVTDVIDAATVYSRLGFDDESSMQFAELTTMYSKVGAVDISEAEANMTALIKAYDIGADQLELVMDKLVKIGNSYPISAAELGEGFNNAASSLSANNNSLNESIALLTVAQETTQNAAKSSTALRTIAARLTNSKAELDELGESTDDLAESTAKYREELLALTGVDIQDQNGQFKSTFQILKGIAGQWERIQKAGNAEAVATLVAGTRQQPVFYSIMQNFEDALKILNDIDGENAAGDMAKAYDTYIESIAGHTEQLKTSFAELSQDIIKSDMVKTVMDVANWIVKVVDGLTKIKLLIPVIVTALSAKNKGFFRFLQPDGDGKSGIKALLGSNIFTASKASIPSNLKDIFSDYNAAAARAGNLTDALKVKITELSNGNRDLCRYLTNLGGKATASIDAYTASLDAAGKQTAILNLKTIALNAVLSLAIAGAIAGISYLVHRTEELQQKAISSADELQRTTESLTTLTQQYKDLYEANGGTWNPATLETVRDIQSQIVDLVGEQGSQIDLVNGKLDDQLKTLREINIENARDWESENQTAISKARDYMERERPSGLVGTTWSYSKIFDPWLAQNAEKYSFTGTIDELIETYKRIYQDFDAYVRENGLSEAAEKDLKKLSDYINSFQTDEYTRQKETYEKWLQNEAVVSQADVLSKGFENQEAFDEYVKSVDGMTDKTQALRDAMVEAVKVAFPEFAAAAAEQANASDKPLRGLAALVEQYKKLKEANDELEKSGNVDLSNRPQVTIDDSPATVYSSNQEFTIGDASAKQNIIVHYTPILPDGTVLSDDAVQSYLQGLIDRSQNAADLLSKDANGKGIILKVDTGLDYNLSDTDLDAIWDLIDGQYERLANLYETQGRVALQKALQDLVRAGTDSGDSAIPPVLDPDTWYDAANAADSVRTPISDVVEYLSAIFDADTWDFDLHSAQEEFYSLQYAAYGSGNSLEDIISKSEELQKLFDGMTVPEVLEFLLNHNPSSAKDASVYFDAAEEISKMQQQLSNAQSQLNSDGTISSETAQEIYTTLKNAGKDYTEFLTIEGDKIKLNTAAYQEFIKLQAGEKSGIDGLKRALAEELFVREQIADLQKRRSEFSGSEGDREKISGEIVVLQQYLQELVGEYGDSDTIPQTIELLQSIFNSGVENTGVLGLKTALEDAEPSATSLSRALEALKKNGNLDELTETDFSNLLTAFPKLKRALNDYSKGAITATKLTEILQDTLNSFDASNEYTNLSDAQSSVKTLADLYAELGSGDGVSFSVLSNLQSAFSNVDGIDQYIKKIQDAKTNTAEVSDIIGTLLYESLVSALGSTEDLANADETLVAAMLKEAGVAKSTSVAHQAIARAKRDSAVATASTVDEAITAANALATEALSAGNTKEAVYNLIVQQILFNNTGLSVADKIAALQTLASAYGVVIGQASTLNGFLASYAGTSTTNIDKTIKGLLATGKAKTVEEAQQIITRRASQAQITAATSALNSNPFGDVDFTSTGGGSDETKAAKIKAAFDELNSTLEHSIYLKEQYYNQADAQSNYDGMRQSLQDQVDYYKQIQTAANNAANQIREYYRSQGLSAEAIEQQSEIQALQKTWWNAANSINDALDKIATAIRDKLSKEIDDVQSAWSSLQKAAEEYSQTGTISIDSLQSIISAGVEYVALLKDENGQLVLNEDAVSAVLEAKTQQLAVESALSYVEQVRNALTQKNATELARLLDVTSVAASSTWDLVYAQAALLNLDSDQYNKLITNINKFRSIANTTVQSVRKQVHDSVTNESKDYKSALDDVLKYVEDLIKYEHEQMVEALQDQADKYNELIEKKKELLQQTKDEEDYERNVSKKLQEIAKIQDQINRLSLDDSREAAAKRAELEQELAELQESLSDYIGDYTSTKNEEALDKSAEDYNDYINDRIKEVEDEVASEERLYQLAIKRINESWNTLYQDILAWNEAAGSSLQSEIIANWDLAAEAVQRYGSFVAAANAASANNSLGDNQSFGDYTQSDNSSNIAAENAIVERMKANATAWHTADDAERQRLNSENMQLAQELSQYVGAMPVRKNGVWYLNGQELFKLYPKYHEGGVVGGIPNRKQQELLTVLKNGELVATTQMQEHAIELVDFAKNISAKLAALPYSSGIGNLLKNDVVSALPKAEPVNRSENSSFVFNPEFNIAIQYSGNMSDDDAGAFGQKIADIAIGKLSDAFSKKGIRNFSGTLLKA